MKQQSLRSALASLAFAGVLAGSAAALTITGPVAPGTGVTISGTGATANGPVELFINGASQGSVAADGSGAFSFTANVTAGDELQVAASQVWNFNTDGDFESWFVPTDDAAVAGGVLTATETSGDGNITIALGTGDDPVGVLDAALTRVAEVRLRVTSTSYDPSAPGGQTFFYMVGPSFPGDMRDLNPVLDNTNGEWRTVVVDLSIDYAAGTSNNGWTTDPINQLVIGGNGFSNGDTVEIDYIRLVEYFDWDFKNDGDFMGFTPNPDTTASVTGGELIMTNNIAATNAWVEQRFANLDSTYFDTLATRVLRDATVSPNLEFWNWLDTPGYAENNSAQWGVPADGTTYDEVVTDLPSLPPNTDTPPTPNSWGELPTTLNAFTQTYSPMYPDTANETARIDYIRLMPSNPVGPSAVVTVDGTASAENWEQYD